MPPAKIRTRMESDSVHLFVRLGGHGFHGDNVGPSNTREVALLTRCILVWKVSRAPPPCASRAANLPALCALLAPPPPSMRKPSRAPR